MFGLTKNSSFKVYSIDKTPTDADRTFVLEHDGIAFYHANGDFYYVEDGVVNEIYVADTGYVNQAPDSVLLVEIGAGDYRLFFVANSNASLHKKLYTFDFTTKTVTAQVETNPGGSDAITNLISPQAGGFVYFVSTNSSGFSKLYQWQSDGVAPVQISDTRPGASDSVTVQCAYSNGVIFKANNSSGFNKSYVFLSGQTVRQISETRSGANDNATNFVVSGNHAFYRSNNSAGLSKPYQCDLSGYNTDTMTSVEATDVFPGGASAPTFTENSVLDGFMYYTATMTGGFVKLYKWALGNSSHSQVSETRPGASDAPTIWTVFNSKLYYVSTNSSGFSKLYSYDGSVQAQVTETRSGASDSPIQIGVFNSKLYYRSTNATGNKVYSWDGSVQAQVTNTGTTNDLLGVVAHIGTTGIYIILTSGTAGGKLYKWDGTTLTQAAEVRTGATEVGTSLYGATDSVYYEATELNLPKTSCWHWDGTTRTKLPEVITYTTTSTFSYPLSISGVTAYAVEYKGNIYFSSVVDGGTVRKTLMWDGKTITSPFGVGTSGSWTVNDAPFNYYVWNDKLVFSSNNSSSAAKNWTWDGTTLTQITQTAATASADRAVDAYGFLALGSNLYWRGNNSSNFSKLYKWSGSGAPAVVTETVAGGNDAPQWMTVMGDSIYYQAVLGGFTKLFRYNGTSRTQVTETRSGANDSPTQLCAHSGSLYYSSVNSSGFTKLYRFNGTTRTQVTETFASNNDSPSYLISYGDSIYYRSFTAASTSKLFRFNGTTRTQVTATNAGGSDNIGGSVLNATGRPQGGDMVVFKDKLYYKAWNASSQYKLYCWDGTTLTQITNINGSGNDIFDQSYPSIMALDYKGVIWRGYDASGVVTIYAYNGTSVVEIDLDKSGADAWSYPWKLSSRTGVFLGENWRDASGSIIVVK
jgi:hypothetical protein